ncbi:low affinity iron permease family protein [Patescibacteria group bacterium]|nr:low affinity iron permease family protein [Patescibacteria group bacterium]
MPIQLPEKAPQGDSPKKTLSHKFEVLSDTVDAIIGTPYWFAFSLFIIVIWVPTGFIVGFGEIWHLMINTTTTILTFLMMSLLHASESKWETRMEKMEEYQRVALNFLKKETERIAALEEAHLSKIEQFQQNSVKNESISSIN